MATTKSITKTARPQTQTLKATESTAGDSPDVNAKNFAHLLTSSEYAAFRVIAGAEPSSMKDRMDVPALVQTLRDQGKAANRNDMTQAEAMLMNQATALQTLFARLAERATSSDYLPNFEALMRISLKAQSQCRATLETLAAIKSPPLVYARQANVCAGAQQINNLTHARKNQKRPNELLERQDGNYLDTGAAGAASRVNPQLEAVGAVHRAKDPRG